MNTQTDNTTARPWNINDNTWEDDPNGGEDVLMGLVISGNDEHVAELNRSVNGQANAELIVKAVNAHDELVQALESVLRWWDAEPRGNEYDEIPLDKIRQALKLAKGESNDNNNS